MHLRCSRSPILNDERVLVTLVQIDNDQLTFCEPLAELPKECISLSAQGQDLPLSMVHEAACVTFLVVCLVIAAADLDLSQAFHWRNKEFA